jgi:hypothetical protein
MIGNKLCGKRFPKAGLLSFCGLCLEKKYNSGGRPKLNEGISES